MKQIPTIGQKVTVSSLTDETARVELYGLIGVVTHFDYDCGCGQTYPDDPMIGVRFESGIVEEFWREELSYA